MERHKFFTCVKKSHETIDICANELCTKAKSCDIGDLTESLLRDRIICGIADDVLHARLLEYKILIYIKQLQSAMQQKAQINN